MKSARTIVSLAGTFGLLMGAFQTAHADTVKVQMVAVEIKGAEGMPSVKAWLPSNIFAYEGDTVEITAKSNVGKPGEDANMHGLAIENHEVAEVIKAESHVVKFKARKPGIYNIFCQLHPAHIGGQLVVLSKSLKK